MKIIWLAIYFATLTWSAINPKDSFTWFLEVLPALLGLGLLAVTYSRFRFSAFTYALILLHCVILMVGGHYTYAEVPLFDDISTWVGWERNNYDKVGHFAQGFVPAAITREILLRRKVCKNEYWQNTFVVSFCLAFSAFYELIEWQVAVMTGEDAEAFLGTQGYVWDTQSDMLLALIGSLCLIAFFRTWQNRSIEKLNNTNS